MKKIIDICFSVPLLSALYFVFGGGGYGALCGLIIGTAMLPVVGTVCGALIGLGLGMTVGGVLAVGTLPVHLLFVVSNAAPETYRRWLSWGVLGASLVSGLIGAGWCVRRLSLSGYPFHPVVWIVILGGIGLAMIWMSFALADLESRFLDKLTETPQEDTQSGAPKEFHGESELDQYMYSFDSDAIDHGMMTTGLISALLMGIALCSIQNPLSSERIGPFLGFVAFSFLIGCYLPAVFALYWVFGAGSLIRFIKRVILDDLWPDPDPDHYRLVLCSIAFVFTLITTWWTFIFAPLLALHAARKLYVHPLTLPDNGFYKAKRKEKNSKPAITIPN